MAARPPDTLQPVAVDLDEEQIVAELGRLGVSYLSRRVAATGALIAWDADVDPAEFQQYSGELERLLGNEA